MIHPDLKQQRSAVIFTVYLRLVSDKRLSAVGSAVQGWRTRCQLNATLIPFKVFFFFSEKQYSPFIWHTFLHILPVLREKSKEASHLGVLIYFPARWGLRSFTSRGRCGQNRAAAEPPCLLGCVLAQWLPTLYLCWHHQAVPVGQAEHGRLCQWQLKIPAGTVSESLF